MSPVRRSFSQPHARARARVRERRACHPQGAARVPAAKEASPQALEGRRRAKRHQSSPPHGRGTAAPRTKAVPTPVVASGARGALSDQASPPDPLPCSWGASTLTEALLALAPPSSAPAPPRTPSSGLSFGPGSPKATTSRVDKRGREVRRGRGAARKSGQVRLHKARSCTRIGATCDATEPHSEVHR